MALEWPWSGPGVALEWPWSGPGVALEWPWSGHGVALVVGATLAPDWATTVSVISTHTATSSRGYGHQCSGIDTHQMLQS